MKTPANMWKNWQKANNLRPTTIDEFTRAIEQLTRQLTFLSEEDYGTTYAVSYRKHANRYIVNVEFPSGQELPVTSLWQPTLNDAFSDVYVTLALILKDVQARQ